MHLNFLKYITIPLVLLVLVGCFEQKKQQNTGPTPRIFFGNKLRQNVDADGHTITDAILTDSVLESVVIYGYVKTNHDTNVKIEVPCEDNVAYNPSQLTIASSANRAGVSINFKDGDSWLGKIGADTHSNMDYSDIHFGSLNEAGDGYSTFAVSLGDEDDATPRGYVDGKFDDFYLYNPSEIADWTHTTNAGEITISGYTGADTDIVVPGVINGYPVTTIGDSAFISKNFTSVVISENITTIGLNSFQFCDLQTLVLPDSLTTMGGGAFKDCANLTTVKFGDNLLSLPSYAFENCYDLTDISLPRKLESIGAHAFYACFSLHNIVIPDTVVSIGAAAFAYADLFTISLPQSVTQVGSSAFSYNDNLTSASIGCLVDFEFTGSSAFANCPLLLGVYYYGNKPESWDDTNFDNSLNVTNYILYGRANWDPPPTPFEGRPTAYWALENYGSGRFLTDVSSSFVEAPSTSLSSGNPGMMAWTNGYFYVCVSNSVWRRVQMDPW